MFSFFFVSHKSVNVIVLKCVGSRVLYKLPTHLLAEQHKRLVFPLKCEYGVFFCTTASCMCAAAGHAHPQLYVNTKCRCNAMPLIAPWYTGDPGELCVWYKQ